MNSLERLHACTSPLLLAGPGLAFAHRSGVLELLAELHPLVCIAYPEITARTQSCDDFRRHLFNPKVTAQPPQQCDDFGVLGGTPPTASSAGAPKCHCRRSPNTLRELSLKS